MAFTRTEWNRLQRSLPDADRISYQEYLASQQEAASSGSTSVDETSIVSSRFVGTGKARVRIDTLSDGRELQTPAPEQEPLLTAEEIQQKITEGIQSGIEAFKLEFERERAESKRAGVTTALEDFRAMLAESGLEGLADDLDRMIRDDFTSAQIKNEIRKKESYEKRFPGMKALSAKNRAVSEGDYISLERGYVQILRSYGLSPEVYGARGELGKYIANEISAKEFEDRVSIAKTRAQEQPEVLKALSGMYGVDESLAIGYLLNPEKGMDEINKRIRASEIGAAAAAAKFNLGDLPAQRAATAEAFIGAAGTSDFTSLKQSFGRARTLADTQKRLAYLEKTGYNEIEAVQAELEQNQQAILASRKRAERELARFGGGTGVTGSSLRRPSAI